MRLLYIECQSCFKKSGYDIAADVGKEIYPREQKFLKGKITTQRWVFHLF